MCAWWLMPLMLGCGRCAPVYGHGHNCCLHYSLIGTWHSALCFTPRRWGWRATGGASVLLCCVGLGPDGTADRGQQRLTASWFSASVFPVHDCTCQAQRRSCSTGLRDGHHDMCIVRAVPCGAGQLLGRPASARLAWRTSSPDVHNQPIASAMMSLIAQCQPRHR